MKDDKRRVYQALIILGIIAIAAIIFFMIQNKSDNSDDISKVPEGTITIEDVNDGDDILNDDGSINLTESDFRKRLKLVLRDFYNKNDFGIKRLTLTDNPLEVRGDISVNRYEIDDYYEMYVNYMTDNKEVVSFEIQVKDDVISSIQAEDEDIRHLVEEKLYKDTAMLIYNANNVIRRDYDNDYEGYEDLIDIVKDTIEKGKEFQIDVGDGVKGTFKQFEGNVLSYFAVSPLKDSDSLNLEGDLIGQTNDKDSNKGDSEEGDERFESSKGVSNIIGDLEFKAKGKLMKLPLNVELLEANGFDVERKDKVLNGEIEPETNSFDVLRASSKDEQTILFSLYNTSKDKVDKKEADINYIRLEEEFITNIDLPFDIKWNDSFESITKSIGHDYRDLLPDNKYMYIAYERENTRVVFGFDNSKELKVVEYEVLSPRLSFD